MATLTQKQTSRRSAFASVRTTRLRETFVGYLFLLPFIVLYCIFKLWPTIQGFWISLHRWDIIGDNVRYIGLSNYDRIWNDRLFWSSIEHTLEFTAISAPLLIIGGLFFALLINRPIAGIGVFRTLYYMPNVLSASVIGVIFVAMFGASPDRGFVNAFLQSINVESIPFLLDVDWAMATVALTTVWWTIGFNILIFLAGLQDIPEEIVDAARVDGANRGQLFWYIILPSLRRPLAFVTVLQVVGSFQVFGQIDIMTQGGPAGQTRTIMYYIFERSFGQWQLGYGSAMAFILFVALFVISIVQLRLFSQEGDAV